MVASRSSKDRLQAAGSGLLARSAASARSMALSTVCHSAAARGFREGSASSQDVSRSLIRVFARERSPLATMDTVSTTIARNGERSPSVEGVAASADATISAEGGRASTPNDAIAITGRKTIALIRMRFVISGVPFSMWCAVTTTYAHVRRTLRSRDLVSGRTLALLVQVLLYSAPVWTFLRNVTRAVMTTRNPILVQTVPSPSPP